MGEPLGLPVGFGDPPVAVAVGLPVGLADEPSPEPADEPPAAGVPAAVPVVPAVPALVPRAAAVRVALALVAVGFVPACRRAGATVVDSFAPPRATPATGAPAAETTVESPTTLIPWSRPRAA